MTSYDLAIIGRGLLGTGREFLGRDPKARVVVIGSDKIAWQIRGSDAVRIVPCRGDYCRLAPGRRYLLRGLIYPVPRRSDARLAERRAYLRYAGFRRMSLRHWRIGVAEIVRDYSKRLFLAALRRNVPALHPSDLPPGPSGIRARAIGSDGTLADDFWFETLPLLVVLRNAPSPSATASLVLARGIVDRSLGPATP